MLTDLHVKNLALIDEAEVSFGQGLNILTGETGAGKSILIDSINLALGQKMSREMIRKGSNTCLVELVFQVDSEKIRKKLQEMDVETEDGQLIISRKITDGRSLCRLNGETCTATRIREISGMLLDIHGQHEHQSLLYPDRQLEILDEYGNEAVASYKEKVSAAYRDYRSVQKALKAYEMNDSEREREMSFLEFEIHEIENAAIQPGEDEELEKQYRRMTNSRKIAETLGTVYERCGGDGGASDCTGSSVRELSAIASYDDALEGLLASLTEIDSLLNDFNREAADYLGDFTFSEEEFYQTEKRLDQINDLKAKYGNTTEKIAAYLEDRKARLEEMQNFDLRRAELLKQADETRSTLEKACAELSAKRQEIASDLAAKIKKELADLNFLSVEFEIGFDRTENYSANGFDAIRFLISTNPGEPVMPLSGVVSGGELSRIMLAIKTLLADKDDTETLIFDEIDTGISGRTAQKVSEKMARIGRSHQVLCITHLAQIASMADHHYEITKQAGESGTTSHVRELSVEESVDELARILGGAEITKAVHENAEEMKRLADAKKQSMS